ELSRALRLIGTLDLDDYYLYHATVADLLERLELPDEAAQAYARALELTINEAERSHLERRMRAVLADSSGGHATS
ncbi:MAG: hypothetical protein WAL25_11800, partial [Acidimicrobiia bacterium]